VGFSQESSDSLHMSSVHDNPSEHLCCVPNWHTFTELHVS
jgi:hypothetical protein